MGRMGRVSTPRVIAHRGASGERPEHTRSAYALAVEQGADGLEVDVVSTKDGVLVCRHEHQIGGTTDVAEHPELADRRTTRTVPGRAEATGWFVEDLTYAELRSRCARASGCRRPGPAARRTTASTRSRPSRRCSTWSPRPGGAGRSACGWSSSTRRTSTRSGSAWSSRCWRRWPSAGLDGPDADVVLESFEPTALTALSERTDLPLMQLLELADKQPADLAALGDPRTFGDLTGHAALDEMAPRIAMLGVHTTHVFPLDPEGATGALSSLVDDAHARGMGVAAFTLRRENRFLPRDLRARRRPGRRGRPGRARCARSPTPAPTR